jgi:DNA-directed RNA polymerase subunit beta'
MREVMGVYSSQGQNIHDKHMEVIVREMFSRVRILSAGDFDELVDGEVSDYFKVVNLVRNNPEKKAPIFERMLLGLTRVSLNTDSWLSAASFQETIRVLVDASVTAKRDTLDGLKENVIIGKLIPAGETYRKIHNIQEEAEICTSTECSAGCEE